MLLQNVRSPKDLKGLTPLELQDMARQLRQTIISQVSKTGGHLAPSLGVVELTLALHFVYNAPEDKIVWDVGHQAYAHKLLTGRYATFNTLRQFRGISGFPRRSESEYDSFGVGHASTSISAALGMAVARDLLHQKHAVVAVIGDGSMTGGMVFEALNNAGSAKSLTIILNDNKMSIAPNVGNFSRYLNRLISDPTYNRVREDWRTLMGRLPGNLGRRVEDMLGRAETVAKSVLKPGRFFEDLGARYFGPIDGHNITEMIDFFNRVRNMPGVNLVHVLTEKGRGLKVAEEDPYRWHGVVPFNVESGAPSVPPKPQPPLTTVFGKALLELARKDRRLVGITGAMPSGCGLSIVEKELPEQIFDVGIAEGHAVTFAAGLATSGMIPVVAIYSTFLQRAYDQILHDVALQNLKVIFVLDRAGLVGSDGPTHHGTFDLTYLRSVPGMTLMAPSDEVEMRNMLHYAIYQCPGPVALRFPRGNALHAEIPEGFSPLSSTSFRIVTEGQEILLLGCGFMLTELLRTAEILRTHGLSPTVVDARFVKPLDAEGYSRLFSGHHLVVTLEDNVLSGGFGSAIAELIADQGCSIRLLRIGIPDIFVEHGEVSRLYRELGMDGESVAQKILQQLERRSHE
ncbi:MAG TPA: 1-deoxy-D-xylulose-5-phosphate synthase [Fibrobacteraceae bacterium]|nr:1-deoxy-D-xylulose-5-phosphate synthase [Fibrobacteraceae bacterium]